MKTSYLHAAAGLATMLLALTIGVLTLSPPQDLPSMSGSDKVHHMLAWAALVFPAATARPASIRWVAPLAILFGAGIELLQPGFGRSASWGDLAADIAGVVMGAALGVLTHHRITAGQRSF